MNKEITIVTAFFDINRSQMDGFNRDNNKYISYFESWARIKNKMVIFSDKDTINEVKRIREKYGLLAQTQTVVIDDYLKIDEELFKSIDKVMQNEQFLKFHLQKNIPEAISSKYNYIMLLKSWLVKTAVENKIADGMVAWLDFGFNYGGRFYRKPEEFDFLWEYDFSEKIHLLQVNDIDNLPPYEIIKRNNSYIQGGEIVAPDYLWSEFWELSRENMLALTKAGLTDDDQLIYLMDYQAKPEIFELHKCEWLGIFKNFSNKKFTFELPEEKITFKELLHRIMHPRDYKFMKCFLYSYEMFKELRKYEFRR